MAGSEESADMCGDSVPSDGSFHTGWGTRSSQGHLQVYLVIFDDYVLPWNMYLEREVIPFARVSKIVLGIGVTLHG